MLKRCYGKIVLNFFLSCLLFSVSSADLCVLEGPLHIFLHVYIDILNAL